VPLTLGTGREAPAVGRFHRDEAFGSSPHMRAHRKNSQDYPQGLRWLQALWAAQNAMVGESRPGFSLFARS